MLFCSKEFLFIFLPIFLVIYYLVPVKFKNIILSFTETTTGGVFMVNLSTKERMLLEDEKSHEQLCVDKYNEYSNKAHCPELKNLFSQLAQKEQQHLDSINQLLNGIVPNINQQPGGQQNNSK